MPARIERAVNVLIGRQAYLSEAHHGVHVGDTVVTSAIEKAFANGHHAPKPFMTDSSSTA